MSDNPMFLYAGEYDSVEDAKADLEVLKEMHREHIVGTYDAAVVTAFTKLADALPQPIARHVTATMVAIETTRSKRTYSIRPSSSGLPFTGWHRTSALPLP